ncbi:MAG: NACHT domain-containing protein, partial [Gammaproteobacteria bacterium]|nr:NACHT domain-containing protein [Gammaproteobacteria bacterium]
MDSTHFADYHKRIAGKAVKHYIPPKFFVTKGDTELSGIQQLTDALARLEPETWFVHSPAGSGKTSLSEHLMLRLLAQDIACVLISVASLKRHTEHNEPHKLIQALKPPKVDEQLWKSRARKKHGKIVVILDGINEIQREFEGKPQWELVLKLLNSNHEFPVLAASRYIPDELDRDDTERSIYLLSLRPFSEAQIQKYLQARGLNAALILDDAAAAGMRDAATNPFLLSLIADQYAGSHSVFTGDWPRSRAELLRRTFARARPSISAAQKNFQENHGLSQEAVLCAASLATEILREPVIPLRELNALLKRIWDKPEQSETIENFSQDFINLHLVDYTEGNGWRFIHDSLLDFGLALACIRRDPDNPPVFAFIPEQFDTLLGNWVGLHPEPDAAALKVMEQARVYATPEKLIDVALANRGVLSTDILNELWQATGSGLLSARRIKIRVADRLGDLPGNILREARRRRLLRPVQKNNEWLAAQVEKALEHGRFSGRYLVSMEREYKRLQRSHNLPKARKKKTRQETPDLLNAVELEKIRRVLADTSLEEQERRRAVMNLCKASVAEASILLVSLLEHDPQDSVRGAAATVLGRLGDGKAVEALAKALLDASARENIRGSAATALGQIGDSKAVEALAKALLDASARENIRGSAATALGQIGDS